MAKDQGSVPKLSERKIVFDGAIPPGNIAGFYDLDTGEHGICPDQALLPLSAARLFSKPYAHAGFRLSKFKR